MGAWWGLPTGAPACHKDLRSDCPCREVTGSMGPVPAGPSWAPVSALWVTDEVSWEPLQTAPPQWLGNQFVGLPPLSFGPVIRREGVASTSVHPRQEKQRTSQNFLRSHVFMEECGPGCSTGKAL